MKPVWRSPPTAVAVWWRLRGNRESGVKVHIVGGGPAGLYLAILMKRADPSHEVLVVERNQVDDTFGFGVVFSEATQENLAQADPETAREMTRALARWEDIDIHYRGSVITSTGHGFAGIERRALLGILARRACELEVEVRFGVGDRSAALAPRMWSSPRTA
jgi:anthraniloyl-CoA monooxygenase